MLGLLWDTRSLYKRNQTWIKVCSYRAVNTNLHGYMRDCKWCIPWRLRAESHFASHFRSVTVPSSFRQNGPCLHCTSRSVTFQNSTWWEACDNFHHICSPIRFLEDSSNSIDVRWRRVKCCSEWQEAYVGSQVLQKQKIIKIWVVPQMIKAISQKCQNKDKISFYFLFPSFPWSSPKTRPFQFLSEDLFGHSILLHSLYVT